MVKINDNFLKLPGGYLFSEIAKRVSAYTSEHPGTKFISMGIGDVTRPLFPSVIRAMHKATDEMAAVETFRGYPPEPGFDFLREIIAEKDYRDRGADISLDEVFISDGAKSDCSNIGDLFSRDNIVAVCDPVYPVYVDSNAMNGMAGDFDGKKWTRLVYLPCTPENGFVPELPSEKADMIYLCYPNNPTGASATREELKKWVDYANSTGAVILYDSAYEAFITTEGVPHSIFEIEGAKTCAIEFRSFSKRAGFTGTRCAYTVIPRDLVRGGGKLRDMWFRRTATKFNGVSYISHRAAEAVYSEDGQREQREVIGYYMRNAKTIRDILDAAGIYYCGGKDAPYIWIRLPDGMGSWQAFDLLLDRAHVITTPGSGFGACGEGFLRVTAFGDANDTLQAAQKMADVLRRG